MSIIDTFDDERLRSELESRGQSVGPIVDSTRNLYRKLLKRLLNEELDSLVSDETMDQQFDGEEYQSPQTDVRSRSAVADNKPQESTKSKVFVFLLSLILCIIFAYFVKK